MSQQQQIGRGTGETILEATDIVKTFGEIVAVDGCSFDIQEGSITGLIGPNGAGKSTMFNVISGFLEPDSGQIVFRGTDITEDEPHEIANRGLVRTFQVTRDLEKMTVMENMMLTPKGQSGEKLRTALLGRGTIAEEDGVIQERALELLELFELDHLKNDLSGDLSGGQRKLLEMARILMMDPDVILLDEPMAGVNPTLENKLISHIEMLCEEEGITFVIVEHDVEMVVNLCDKIVVMNQGTDLAVGPPEEIKNDERVINAYLGGELE